MTTRSTLLNAARDTDEDVAWKLVTQHARGIITPAELDYKLAELIFEAKPIEKYEQYVQDAMTAAYTNYAESMRKSAEAAHVSLRVAGLEDTPFITGVWPIPEMPEFDVRDVWSNCRQEAKGHKDGQLIEASRLFWLAVEQHADDTSSWSLKILKSMNDLKAHVVEVRNALGRRQAVEVQYDKPSGLVYYVKSPEWIERGYQVGVNGPLTFENVVNDFGQVIFNLAQTPTAEQASGWLEDAGIDRIQGEWHYKSPTSNWEFGRAKVSD